jgi:hypothetical protein
MSGKWECVDCVIKYVVMLYVVTIKFSYTLKQPSCKKLHSTIIGYNFILFSQQLK